MGTKPRKLMAAAFGVWIVTAAPGPSLLAEDREPRDVGIEQRVKRELLQIDLSVRGPLDVIESLAPSNLQIKIARREFPVSALDRVCASDVRPVPTSSDTATAGSSRRHASFLFYFDQHHLTPEGRERSIELARELVPQLIRDGNHAMVVSAGREMRVFVDWTEDQTRLIDGLERLHADPGQRDDYPAQEELRIAYLQSVWEVTNDLAGGVTVPKGQSATNDLEKRLALKERMARREDANWTVRLTQNELREYEESHTRHALSRFSSVLPSLSQMEAPKAVLYFADTVRANPGEHFMTVFKPPGWWGGTCGVTNPACHVSGGNVVPEFQRVIELSFTHDIRLYTVQAQGLVDETGPNLATSGATIALGGPTAAGQRFVDSKSALAAFALETGGQSFLNGVGPDEIARRIAEDLWCIYVASVDPGDLPRDRRLKLKVKTTLPGLTIRSRSGVMILSDEERLRTRIETAALQPSSWEQAEPMRVLVIPTDFLDRSYRGLVQVVLPAVHAAGGAWDVGITLAADRGKRRQVSRRVQLTHPGVPLIFETEMEFPPGPFALTAVAHQRPGDLVISHRTEGVWPEHGSPGVSAGPSVLIQPATGVFVRDDRARKSGSLARYRGEWIDPDLPVALVGMVCRGGQDWPPGATVRRRLIGTSVTPFEEFHPDAALRCAFFRDVVPPGVLTSGRFHYEVEVVRAGGESVVTGSEPFTVVSEEYRLAAGR